MNLFSKNLTVDCPVVFGLGAMLTLVAMTSIAAAQDLSRIDYELYSGVTSTSVRVDDDERTRMQTQQTGEIVTIVGPMGVEDCRRLKNDPASERNISFSIQGQLQNVGNDHYIREYDVDEMTPVCDPPQDEDVSGCTRLSNDGQRMQVSVTNSGVEVNANLVRLMEWDDDTVETCAFRGTEGSTGSNGGGSDAGTDVGMADVQGTQDTTNGSGANLPDHLYTLRLFVPTGQGSADATDAILYLDRTRPPMADNLDANATQNQIQVAFNRPTDRYEDVEQGFVFWSTQPFSSNNGEDLFDTNGVGQSSFGFPDDESTAPDRLEQQVDADLESGEQLYVAVATRDYADNFSKIAEVSSPITVATERGLGDLYTEAGGSERGGCGCSSSSPDGLPAGFLFGFIALVGLGASRRTLKAIGMVGAFAMVFVAAPAHAQSDIMGNFEFRLGPYYPSIDSEFDGNAKPFEDSFGTNNRVMFEMKVDGYVYQGHGKLGVGGTLGYTNFTGDAQITGGGSGGGDADIDAKTKFQMLPLRAQVFYRWDYLVEQFKVPIAPRVEAGLDWYMWRIRDGSGNTVNFGEDGPKASGATAGYHGAAGIEVNLNPLDRQTAATFDYTWGVNRTYLFAMYEISRVNDFGGNGFDLSDETWRMGLAFEF